MKRISEICLACWLALASSAFAGQKPNIVFTLTDILHREGYVCGLSGKWHLGDNMDPQDGFSFWITKQHGHSAGFLNQEVIEDGKFRTIPKHLSEYWTDRGIEFIEQSQQANPEKPFFLFLAYNGPYTLARSLRSTPGWGEIFKC